MPSIPDPQATTDPPGEGLGAADRGSLLTLARRAIAYGLDHGRVLAVDPSSHTPPLQAHRAAFVTLTQGTRLRGCVGHLEPRQPLVCDVAENAYAAAFRDPRFAPLASDELSSTRIQVSVLSLPEPLAFCSEADLLRQLVPGRDGLILRAGTARGTFLPTVWESLPKPLDFLRHLKQKAGLRADYWGEDVAVWRYHTECFAE